MEGRFLFLLAFATLLGAQTVEPRSKADDYPLHVELSPVSMGAEYLVHSFSARNQTYAVKDYLVVEVALFGPKGMGVELSNSHFTLRLNGKGRAILAQSPTFVAASLKYPDWEYRPRVQMGGGIGDAGVILGRPEATERFPGDRRPTQQRLPRPPGAPEPEDRSGLDREPPPRPEELVIETALPEGPAALPVKGFLYFPYKENTKSIKSLDLLYRGPLGAATLRLLAPSRR